MKRALSSVLLVLAACLALTRPADAQQTLAYGDGPGQVAVLYQGPPGAPVLVWVTGTGWVMASPDIARPFASALQGAGVTVVLPQYTTGAPAAAVADVERALTFAAALPDRGPLILGGHSAGAQLAALAVLRDRVNVDGLLLVSGMYDLPGTVQDGGVAARLVQQAFGADPAEWEAQSPLTYVRSDVPPTWVVHGARDTDVKPERAAAFAQRLQQAGARVTWTLLPDAGHVDSALALWRQRDTLLSFLRGGSLLAGS